MFVQYYFNLEEKLSQEKTREGKYQMMRHAMMARGKMYALKLSYKDHQEFLTYWFGTQKTYAPSKKNI